MRVSTIVATGAMGALLAAGSIADAAPTACTLDRIGIRSFHIEAKKPRPRTYEVGDVVTVKLSVTRPADEDPAGQGQPTERPVSTPAEGVRVGMSAWVKRTYFYDFGDLTNAEGKTTIKLRIPDYAQSGWVLAEAGAERYIGDVPPCWQVYEEGFASWARFFKIE